MNGVVETATLLWTDLVIHKENGSIFNRKPMPTQRAALAAVNCDGAIYAIGGRSGINKSTSLKPVQKFDSTANKWKYVFDINSKHHSHVASVLRNRI